MRRRQRVKPTIILHCRKCGRIKDEQVKVLRLSDGECFTVRHEERYGRCRWVDVRDKNNIIQVDNCLVM